MRESIRSVLFLGLAIVAGCGESFSEETAGPSSGFNLTFEDEFEGAAGSPPDLSKWAFDIGTGTNGWGNNELQNYTGRPDNVSLDGNGNLVITARREDFAESGFTSGRIKTQGLFEQRYGRFEARMRLPGPGAGLWPAFWMLGSEFGDESSNVPWPFVGEIDVMENIGDEETIYGTVHGPGYSGGDSIGRRLVTPGEDYTADFHVYRVDWDPSSIRWYVDGDLYFTLQVGDTPGDWVFDTPFFMILNLAVGGSFPGSPTDATPFPAELVVDWVRVYERNPG
ncbi:MAG: glycoside hydrolase family 16 protein [Myxococcota bacterium]